MSLMRRNLAQSGIIKSMIHSSDYFEMKFSDHLSLVDAPTYVPNGFIELIFLKNLKAFEVFSDERFEELPQAFVWGQVKQGGKVVLTGEGVWFEIKLYPWAFEVIFGHSAISLYEGRIPLSELDKEFGVLSEQLTEASSNLQAMRLFEQFVTLRLASMKTIDPRWVHGFNLIHNSHGQKKISEICCALNVSRQYFHETFKDKIGLAPKAYAKIIRLRHTVDQLYTNTDASQMQVILDSGYFDQAHFISDFQSILQQSPRSFFKEKQFIYWDL